MSKQVEQADRDEEWLYKMAAPAHRNLTTDQVDDFCERVWELMSVYTMTEAQARLKALGEIA